LEFSFDKKLIKILKIKKKGKKRKKKGTDTFFFKKTNFQNLNSYTDFFMLLFLKKSGKLKNKTIKK
jgi:hypothetical protein